MTAGIEPGAHAATIEVSASRHVVDVVIRIREFGILAALILLVTITASLQSRFLSSTELKFILEDSSIFALLSLGEMMCIVTRNYDLSVGSVLGLSAFLSARLFSEVHGIPIPVVFLVGLGIGLGCGTVNGLISAVGRVPSLVVTLAMLYIIRAVDILIVGGGQVVGSSLPNSFVRIPTESIGGVPYLAIVIAVIIVAGAYYLRSYRSGRELYAIGSNPDAARLGGIPIAKRVFTAFAVSGALAGVAGVIYSARFGTIDSTAGTGYELQVIAAVVVGGVAIFGGSGSAIGAALGAVLLNTILSALYVLGISPFWDQAISGLLLISAISLDRGIQVRLTTALRRRRSRLGA